MQDKYKERLLRELERQREEKRRAEAERNRRKRAAIFLGFLIVVLLVGGVVLIKFLSKPKTDSDETLANGEELIDDE